MIDPIITDLKALRKKSVPTTVEEVKDLNLVERLKASNDTAWARGVGLAAVQIGIYLRAGWFIADEEEHVLINPVIVEGRNVTCHPHEGCLSIPNLWIPTRRFHDIKVRNTTEKGENIIEFSGFAAIVAQHMIDHMDGVLLVDRRYVPKNKAGRNDPCPCNSGKKYKKCCIDKIVQPISSKGGV